MESFFQIAIYAQELLSAFGNSLFFLVIKIILFIYVAVLFIDIILLIFLRNLREDLRYVFIGAGNIPMLKIKKIQKQWEEIEKKLKDNNLSYVKAAILEADNMLKEVLLKLGYSGKNLGEILKNIPEGQIKNQGELLEAHKIRNRIIYEEDFELNKKEASRFLEIYKDFFKAMKFLN